MNQPTHIAIDSAVLLTVLTAYLYAVSTAYYGGYLGPLNLDADILDRNFNQTLYNGFLLCLAPAMLFVFAIALFSLMYSHIWLPSINDWLRRSFRNKRKYVNAHRWFFGRRRDSWIEVREKRRSLHAWAYVAGAVLVLVSLVYAESIGRRAANTIKNSLSDGTFRNQPLWHVRIDDTNRTLLPLACGARNCAGLDVPSKLVYYFPQSGHAHDFRAVVPVASSPGSAASAK